MKKKAISLLSGGLDSTVSTALAQPHYDVCLALTFNYNQKSALHEIKAASHVANLLSIPHRCIDLPWLGSITHTALVNKKFETPNRFDRESVWVPNRNALFVSIAGCFAESMDAEYIITGFNEEEGSSFPDNSQEFVDQMNGLFKYSSLKEIELKSFTQKMNKVQIVERFVSMGFKLSDIWYCYNGGKKPCKQCESCLRNIAAFVRLGVIDI